MLYLKRFDIAHGLTIALLVRTTALLVSATVLHVMVASPPALAGDLAGAIAPSEAPVTRPATMPRGEGFANPLDVIVADPFVHREGKEYYLYGTRGRSGMMVWTSDNLVDWRARGYAFTRSPDTYSQRHFWAPELFKHGSRYYLHFTASNPRTTLRLVLCESDSPAGPFREIKAPWFESELAVIDGNVFRDEDGQLYLYYVLDCSENEVSEIYVRRLDGDLVPEKVPTFCVKPSQDWEGSTWNEAPFVMKRNGVYYLMYSSNYFGDRDYSVGYATAPSPLGPWTKFEGNPILAATDGVSGPGHNAVIDSPDGKEQFIVYHTHQQTSGQGWHRQLAIDRLRFVDGGDGTPAKMVVDGPTLELAAMPSGAKRGPVARSDDFNRNLNLEQWMIMSALPTNWEIDGGQLRILGIDGDIAGDRADIRNLFLQYAPAGDFDVTTRLTIQPKADYEQAFLTVYQDHNRFIKVSSVWSQGGRKIEFATDIGGTYEFELTENTFGDSVLLRISRRGDVFSAYVSRSGRKWTTLKENVALKLIDAKVGLGACSPGSEQPIEAAFDFFRVEQVGHR